VFVTGILAPWIEYKINGVEVRPFVLASLVFIGVVPFGHWLYITPDVYREEVTKVRISCINICQSKLRFYTILFIAWYFASLTKYKKRYNRVQMSHLHAKDFSYCRNSFWCLPGTLWASHCLSPKCLSDSSQRGKYYSYSFLLLWSIFCCGQICLLLSVGQFGSTMHFILTTHLFLNFLSLSTAFWPRKCLPRILCGTCVCSAQCMCGFIFWFSTRRCWRATAVMRTNTAQLQQATPCVTPLPMAPAWLSNFLYYMCVSGGSWYDKY